MFKISIIIQKNKTISRMDLSNKNNKHVYIHNILLDRLDVLVFVYFYMINM